MRCEHDGCTVEAMVGETTCSDHLTCSDFLGEDAARNGTKSAARTTSSNKGTLRPGTVAHQIAAYLHASPRVAFTPQELARALRMTKGTVTKELVRLERRRNQSGDPFVARGPAGSYRAYRDLDTLARIEQPMVGLHAIQASQPMPLNRGWGPPAAGRDVAWKYDERTGQYQARIWWGAHETTVAVSTSTGSVQVGLKASDYTINPEGFTAWASWLDGLLAGQGIRWVPELTTLNNLEVNRDHRRVAIADARRFSIRQWSNLWAQGYQKDFERFRREVRASFPKDEALLLTEVQSVLHRMVEAPRREVVRANDFLGEAAPVPAPAFDYEVI